MPRRPRIHLDGVTLDIVQRPDSRMLLFAEQDYHSVVYRRDPDSVFIIAVFPSRQGAH